MQGLLEQVAPVSGPFDGLAHEPRRHGVRRCVSCHLDAPAGRMPPLDRDRPGPARRSRKTAPRHGWAVARA
jgi:hypothetical protein